MSLAPNIRVNGLALGAILPPADGVSGDVLKGVPSGRWGTAEETVEALLFLLVGPDYVTGEILHVDGGYNAMGSPGRLLDAYRDAQ